MDALTLSVDDLYHHAAKFGIDIFPPVEIPDERTRLNMFYEEARQNWPNLYDQLLASDTEFKISKHFKKRPEIAGPSVPVDTFVLTNRGPVFVFPFVLPEPAGNTGLDRTFLEDFRSVRRLFFSRVAGRKLMRVGLIRELLFSTGETPCWEVLTAQTSFSGAELAGGNSLIQYHDSKCNVRLQFAPVEILKATQLPVGQSVQERAGYGLHVSLDVNNREIRPLEESDIEEILERASSFWPNQLLEFFEHRRPL